MNGCITIQLFNLLNQLKRERRMCEAKREGSKRLVVPWWTNPSEQCALECRSLLPRWPYVECKHWNLPDCPLEPRRNPVGNPSDAAEALPTSLETFLGVSYRTEQTIPRLLRLSRSLTWPLLCHRSIASSTFDWGELCKDRRDEENETSALLSMTARLNCILIDKRYAIENKSSSINYRDQSATLKGTRTKTRS